MTLVLTGALPFLLILAAALALPVSILILGRYRRAVLRSMRTHARSTPSERSSDEVSVSPRLSAQAVLEFEFIDQGSSMAGGATTETHLAKLRRAPWRAGFVYAIAGFGFALVMATARLLSYQTEFLPLRFLVLFWTYSWPVVLTINLVAAATRRAKFATMFTYFFIFFALGAIAMSPPLTWDEFLTAWFIFNLPNTVLLLAFLNRKIRAVGPLVLTFMVFGVVGSELVFLWGDSEEGFLRFVAKLSITLGWNVYIVFFGFVAFGFAIFGLIGWLILQEIRKRYEQKKINDQSLTLDAVWLLFGTVYSIFLAFAGAVWMLAGLVAFLIYKVVTRLGFFLLNKKANQSRENTRLLLLRVFSLGKRSERLFDALTIYWRHAGSIQFIAGPDLVTTTVEPHEFLDFVSGKLARRFIADQETFNLRISEMDLAPDRDGRFRVNDFFCHDDTWKMVLSRLVSENDAVLMDLRGFSPQNAGCIFEINELINLVPLVRVVFIIDDTTDNQFLRQTLQHSWERMRADSPNRQAPFARLRLFRFTGSRRGELLQLIRALCVAAKNPNAAGSEAFEPG